MTSSRDLARSDRAFSDPNTGTDSALADDYTREDEILRTLFGRIALGQAVTFSRSTIVSTIARVVVILCIAKAVLHSLAWVSGFAIAPVTAPFPPLVHALMFFGFGVPAILLVIGGRSDRRAAYLGGFFLLISIAFIREPGRQLGGLLVGAAWAPIRFLLFANFDAFLPFFLWLFAAEFPRAARGSVARGLARLFIPLSLVCAGMLAVLDASRNASELPIAIQTLLNDVGVVGRSNTYWGITFALIAAGLGVVLVRSRRAVGSEGVRASWLSLSLIVGLAPVVGEVIAESLSNTFEAWAQSRHMRPIVGALLFPPLLTIPASASYALIFQPVLRVQLVIRRALQCSVTKYLFIAVCLAPVVVLGTRAFADRHLTIVELLSDSTIQLLVVLAASGIVALVFTERILQRIDLAFFGPTYDAKGILSELTLRMGRGADPAAIVEMLAAVVQRTLSPVKTTISLVRRDTPGDWRRPEDLRADTPLIDIATALRTPCLIVTDRLYRLVDSADAAWLAKTGAYLIVPLKTWDGTVLGLIAVSERGSETPYSDEDREFLDDVAAAGALALEKQRVRRERRQDTARVDDGLAFECRSCGSVTAAGHGSVCMACGDPLELSCLPKTLNGKFRIDRRLGEGGMGVVYAAIDLALNRCVAVKTLPFASAGAEQRLRNEAQTMAKLAHPNLAAIYGFETWDGRPLLVAEFLERGTLAARLATNAVSVDQLLTWGIELCDGLTCLHRHGLLHGDIKPSNIGFDAADAAKFLDFGLTDAFDSTPSQRVGDETDVPRWGTRRYWCPEATSRAPCPQFDLWSLALVLYEALAGRRFEAQLTRPLVPPDVRRYRADVPDELARVLGNALHREFDRRPRSAVELGLWLSGARPVA